MRRDHVGCLVLDDIGPGRLEEPLMTYPAFQ
jgi:hypothetical protein